jgi:hydroxymethylpyrimidine/phosphomethylpyrimidine kinase
MVSTSGAQLLPESAIDTLIKELLPLATLLTPNVPEANLLLSKAGKSSIDVQSLEDLKSLAAAVHALGPRFVLLKGGHCPLTTNRKLAVDDHSKRVVVNVLVGANVLEIIEFPYQKSKNTHGTGCSLACQSLSPTRMYFPSDLYPSCHRLQSCTGC